MFVMPVRRVSRNPVESARSGADRALIFKLSLNLLISNSYAITNLSKMAHVRERKMP